MANNKHLKVVDQSGSVRGAVLFDENVDMATRIELTELVRMNDYKLIQIEEEEYNKIPKKFSI